MLDFLKRYLQERLMRLQEDIAKVRREIYSRMSPEKGEIVKILIEKETRFISGLRMI